MGVISGLRRFETKLNYYRDGRKADVYLEVHGDFVACYSGTCQGT